MKVTFNIEYQTVWGEEIKLVIGGRIISMEYLPGGVWTAEFISMKGRTHGITGQEYHYECWREGHRIRREWRNHIVPKKLSAEAVLDDSWTDIPEDAPCRSSAFADNVFAVDQDNALGPGRNKVNADVTPEAMFRNGWKCAGTAVPVFSIRTKDSFGIGDFHDLKKMVDWTAATGQRVIQLLPVNDTTMTGTWKDSYPYSANSIYALHPQFIYLPDAGVRQDKEYRDVQAELEALPDVDYERVNREKDRFLRIAFKKKWAKVSSTPEFRDFVNENRHWLREYCAFRILLVKTGCANPDDWGRFSEYDPNKIRNLIERNQEEADYYMFVQFHLHKQLTEARDYARKKGIVLKGDLPIGVSRTGVDSWQHPSQFNMDSQAGAPPDAFARDGQMWGFPTYNWDKMAEDGFSWWKARLKNMEQYFDLFRIDHILGFFRIWEVPAGASSGLLGHFSPALPYSGKELAGLGFNLGTGLYTGEGLDTLFVEDTRRKGFWHPRIAAQETERYRRLPDNRREAYDRLYNDFFYHRHDNFWRESALGKLPDLLASTRMLACGEDLGMIPGCVPEVMDKLRILSLEIQRMPKEMGAEFADTESYPYLSVCATSTHDMTPLRAWWKENRSVTQKFWNQVLGRKGDAPEDCTPDICLSIIKMHLMSRSMFAILPIQDWLALKPEFCHTDPSMERVNDPATTPFYWKFRMKVPLEAIINDALTPELKKLVRDCGRQ